MYSCIKLGNCRVTVGYYSCNNKQSLNNFLILYMNTFNICFQSKITLPKLIYSKLALFVLNFHTKNIVVNMVENY